MLVQYPYFIKWCNLSSFKLSITILLVLKIWFNFNTELHTRRSDLIFTHCAPKIAKMKQTHYVLYVVCLVVFSSAYSAGIIQMRDFIFYLILGHTLKSYFHKLNRSWYVANNIVIHLIIHFFQHKQHAIKVSAELFTKDYQTNSYKDLTTTWWVYVYYYISLLHIFGIT